MREIKFRVWNIETKEFLGNFNQETFIPADWDFNSCFDNDSVIWQQFTGLKDKNGKEIYEGDIVKWSNLNYTIEWNDIGYEWRGRCYDYLECPDRNHKPCVGYFKDLANGVIAGNIFENQKA